tara:strand:- start:2580 stop:3146 length:567 start_codon:yes stop_codon:yes gene_type:complete
MGAKNKLIKLIFFIGVFLIFFFQIEKKRASFKKDIYLNNKSQEITDYKKLLELFPVYKDSIYYIYIAKINNHPKIIYLKKSTINEVQKESKFFVHIYPKDRSVLNRNQNFLSFDFKNNVKEYDLKGRKVFISELDLPQIAIKKINTGQYGFRGRSSEISWRIEKTLTFQEIKKNLNANKEKEIYSFEE